MNLIYIIENERTLSDLIKASLVENGFSVKSSPNTSDYLLLLKTFTPDLIILDWDLPDISAETIVKEIQKLKPYIPIIIISGNKNSDELVKGFEMGVKDWVKKPIDIDELIARVKIRIQNYHPTGIYQIKDLILDDKKKLVTRRKKIINLSVHEFELLKYLMINKDQVVTREMIISSVWSGKEYIIGRIVDVYINSLRKKIDNNFPTPLIKTMWGFGYTIDSK